MNTHDLDDRRFTVGNLKHDLKIKAVPQISVWKDHVVKIVLRIPETVTPFRLLSQRLGSVKLQKPGDSMNDVPRIPVPTAHPFACVPLPDHATRQPAGQRLKDQVVFVWIMHAPSPVSTRRQLDSSHDLILVKSAHWAASQFHDLTPSPPSQALVGTDREAGRPGACIGSSRRSSLDRAPRWRDAPPRFPLYGLSRKLLRIRGPRSGVGGYNEVSTRRGPAVRPVLLDPHPRAP